MVKAIIFDLWGTLIENGVNPSPSKQVRYFLRVRAQFPEFITTFEDVFMREEFESLKAGFEGVVKAFDLNIPDFVYEKLVGMWNKNAILSEMYDDTEQSLKDLKEKGYKLFLLANIDKFAYEQVNQKFDLEKYFDGVYCSYKTGHLKVDKESYLDILKEHKLKIKDVLVVGDSMVSDIAGADNAGLKSVLIDRRETREYDPKIVTLGDLQGFIDGMQG